MNIFIRLLRPKHWVKNMFLFAAPFFGGELLSHETLGSAPAAFLAFSSAASASYIINDIADRKADRLHPVKKLRPIAAGEVSLASGGVLAVLLLTGSAVTAYFIDYVFLSYMGIYLVIQACYSMYFKNTAVLDIFCIASGFVMRVLAGGAAFHVPISDWLFLAMFMISLMLATGKRIGELKLLNENAAAHRESLSGFTPALLNDILLITAASSLVFYAVYTIEQYKNFIYTVPVVTFGLFRYLMLAKEGRGDPTDAMTGDRWLALTVICWLLSIGIIRYAKLEVF
ncbi:decaprenyl-phosphate phosphoribosyltransferase [Candidatus Magnetominusculus xianensis]|uniref:Decaprenyl-phosphate phosphoribosyltransferase n=1 Tax=Candidatus Magnetominusculus xianensis TaxID=1748249 RepID=A0ABR5SDD5_9BACT|nr:decaprenyl-phosphate phosphoribosyltransferase [Candidatus Magnetominusculus xianensis]KWT82951.1 decaprenyl-phosphate phosphoribosyltransferase [Candidatus Magnetominusculus xianensis]MBF0403030.1 decaprenyl-phosphate phosphoribosyltransferase [Nitrospirota bacterium]